jgi:hypothetical protein
VLVLELGLVGARGESCTRVGGLDLQVAHIEARAADDSDVATLDVPVVVANMRAPFPSMRKWWRFSSTGVRSRRQSAPASSWTTPPSGVGSTKAWRLLVTSVALVRSMAPVASSAVAAAAGKAAEIVTSAQVATTSVRTGT